MGSLEIRSQLAKAGACQGANCLNSQWVCTALCSDKCLLCFSEKSDLLKPSHLPLFSFALSLPSANNWIWKVKNHFTCQLQSAPYCHRVASFLNQGRELPCSHSGDWKPLWEERGSTIFMAHTCHLQRRWARLQESCMKAMSQLSQRAENEGESPGGLISCLGTGPQVVITPWKSHLPPKMGGTIVSGTANTSSCLAFEAKTNFLLFFLFLTLYYWRRCCHNRWL